MRSSRGAGQRGRPRHRPPTWPSNPSPSLPSLLGHRPIAHAATDALSVIAIFASYWPSLHFVLPAIGYPPNNGKRISPWHDSLLRGVPLPWWRGVKGGARRPQGHTRAERYGRTPREGAPRFPRSGPAAYKEGGGGRSEKRRAGLRGWSLLSAAHPSQPSPHGLLSVLTPFACPALPCSAVIVHSD